MHEKKSELFQERLEPPLKNFWHTVNEYESKLLTNTKFYFILHIKFLDNNFLVKYKKVNLVQNIKRLENK